MSKPFYETKLVQFRPSQVSLLALLFIVANRVTDLAIREEWNEEKCSFHEFMLRDYNLRKTINWAFPFSAYSWLGHEIDLFKRGTIPLETISARNHTINWPLFSDAPSWKVVDGYLMLKHKWTPLRFETFNESILENFWEDVNWLQLNVVSGGNVTARFFKIDQSKLGTSINPYYSTEALNIMGIGGVK